MPIDRDLGNRKPAFAGKEQYLNIEGEPFGGLARKDSIRRGPGKELESALRKKEDERFKKAADQLQMEISKSPELKELKNNLLVDITPEGLRIQIIDDKGRSMFPLGSAQMYDFMRQLLLKVAGVIKPMTNHVSVRGHTDSFKYKDPSRYDNWNLSSDRAQSSRRVLVEGGLTEARVENVMGRADREHLDTKNPQSEKNRRISIILLRDKIKPKPADKNAAKTQQQQGKKPVIGGIQIVDDTQPPRTPTASATGKPATGPLGPDAGQPQESLPQLASQHCFL